MTQPTAVRPRAIIGAVDLVVYVLVPVIGLLFWGWDWRPIVLLYWLENVTIGVTTYLALRRSRAAGGPQAQLPPEFFLMHYGTFTLVHGVFVIVMLILIPVIAEVPAEWFNPVWVILAWAVASVIQVVLAVRATPPPPAGVGHAYGRVIALHITVVLAVWLIVELSLPAMMAIMLVVLHGAIQLGSLLLGSRVGGGRWVQTGPGRWTYSKSETAG